VAAGDALVRSPAASLDKEIAMHKSIGRREEGQALVEFALVAPILFLILFGIVQFGIAFKHSIALTDAVRAGARKATVSRSLADPVSATESAVLGAASDLDPSQVKVKVTVPSGWTPGANVTVTATYPYEINILGIVVASGDLHSATTERVEY
jgi:Flp pilus assembly protein TadG